MPQQSASIPSPYTAIDYYWPVEFEYDNSDQPNKLIVKDLWYGFVERIYNWYQEYSNLFSGVSFSMDILDQLGLPKVPEVPVKLDGLGVIVFVIRFVVHAAIWAARRSIELSKFKLHSGGWGASGIGWTPMGAIIYREC
jgi:hypothetical protein